MKIILLSLILLIIGMNACGESLDKLNETWILQAPHKSQLKIQFLPDNTFKSSGEYSNRWYTNAVGTYHFQAESNEIFVTVNNASLDWLYKPATENEPEEYWGENFSNYQLYFKIIDINKNEKTVLEYINSYDEDIPESTSFYSQEPIWKEENGKFILTSQNKERFVEKKYDIEEN